MKTAANQLLLLLIILGVVFSPSARAQILAQDLAVAAVGAAGTSQALAQGKAVEQQAQMVNKARSAAPAQQKALPTVPNPGDVSLESPGAAVPHIEEPSLGGQEESFEISPPKSAGPPKLSGGKKQDMTGPKVPDSVNNVIKRLNTATDNVTLEDLNSAREAVAKLDILIDIEKRLSDLDTLRGEREDKKLSAAIPASALGMRGGSMPPPSMAPIAPAQPGPTPVVTAPAPVFSPPPPEIVVERITGAGGRYVALVKSGEGKTVMMREGDKTPDGSVVTSITSRGVTLEKNKASRTIQVKDVTVVFNGR